MAVRMVCWVISNLEDVTQGFREALSVPMKGYLLFSRKNSSITPSIPGCYGQSSFDAGNDFRCCTATEAIILSAHAARGSSASKRTVCRGLGFTVREETKCQIHKLRRKYVVLC